MSVRLEVRGVSFGYRPARPAVVADLDLTVEAGRVTTVLGPSGSGKSTLLALIAGVEAPWSGDILFDGATVTGVPAHRRDIALVLQQPYLFPNMSVADNVAFGLAARGIAKGERARQADRWLARVGLDGMAARRPRELSGGEQQRVALVRALATRPKVLLLDEPLASVDPLVRDTLQALLRDIVAETGVTTVIVTHDLSEAMALGSRTALMDAGRLVAEGLSQEVFQRPPSRAAARFVGVSVFLVGEALDGVLTTRAGAFAVDDPTATGRLTYAIRPEHVRVVDAAGPNRLAAVVSSCTYRGEYWEVTLETSAGVISVRREQATAVGAPLIVELPASRLFRVGDPDTSGPQR